MAATVPTIEPLEIRAGDSVSWTRDITDYPASSYTLTYRVRGPSTLDITAGADGDTFEVAITAAQTAELPKGEYWITGRVDDGAGDIKTVYHGRLTVLPNFAAAADVSAGYDERSHARKCRDNLRAAMEDTTGSFIINYSLFGERQVELETADGRLKLLGYYEGLVQQEEKAEALARGERQGLYIRFRNPR